jgi:hypothetical protein
MMFIDLFILLGFSDTLKIPITVNNHIARRWIRKDESVMIVILNTV